MGTTIKGLRVSIPLGSLSKDKISSEMIPYSAPSIGILEALDPVAISMFFTYKSILRANALSDLLIKYLVCSQ